jgi:O-methyltransferase
MKSFLKKLYRIPFKIFDIGYKHKFDNLKTRNNFQFLKDEKFINVIKETKQITNNHRINIPLRVHQAIFCAFNSLNKDGVFVELGTGRGYVFLSILNYLEENIKSKEIFLFDTFLPYKTSQIDGTQSINNTISDIYAPEFSYVQNIFSKWSNVKLIRGLVPETLSVLINNNKKISFLHIDLNFYKPEIEALNYLWDNINLGAYILLDDFGNPGREIQCEAYTNFFSKKNQFILNLATGQGLVIKS